MMMQMFEHMMSRHNKSHVTPQVVQMLPSKRKPLALQDQPAETSPEKAEETAEKEEAKEEAPAAKKNCLGATPEMKCIEDMAAMVEEQLKKNKVHNKKNKRLKKMRLKTRKQSR